MDKKITLKEFWDSKAGLAIRCITEEQAKKLLKAFDKLGKKWNSGSSYLDLTYWNRHTYEMNYGNNGTCSSKRAYYITIYEFGDVIFEEEKTTIKKEIRDLTLEEFNNWRDENCYKTPCEECPFVGVNCDSDGNSSWINHKELFSNTFLNQEVEIEGSILNDKEKEYLRAVIKPFKVRYIYKTHTLINDDYIVIKIDRKDCDCSSEIQLPNFKANTMYKNMKLDKKYTLEELGL